MDPLPATIIAICLSVLFACAGGGKFLDIRRFRGILADYRILPLRTVAALAWLIPGLEVLLGLGWLLEPGLTVAAASAALLAVYAAAIAVNLLRGRRDISCGCSFGSADRLSWWLVLRNGLLAAAALAPALPSASRPLEAGDYLSAIAAVLAVIVLYLATQQLIANTTAVTAWRDLDGSA